MAAYYGPFPVAGLRGTAATLYHQQVDWNAVQVPKEAIKDIWIEEVQVYTPGEIAAAFIFMPSGPVIEFLEQHALLWFVKALACIDGQPTFISLPIRGSWDVSGPSTHVREAVTRKVLRYTLDVFRDGFPSVPRREGIPTVGVGRYAPPVTNAYQAVISGRSASPCGTTSVGKLPIGRFGPQPPSTGIGGGTGGTNPPSDGPPSPGTGGGTKAAEMDNRYIIIGLLAALAVAFILYRS
jgi:hypothetical protein